MEIVELEINCIVSSIPLLLVTAVYFFEEFIIASPHVKALDHMVKEGRSKQLLLLLV